jgi:hypothetical protein
MEETKKLEWEKPVLKNLGSVKLRFITLGDPSNDCIYGNTPAFDCITGINVD